MGIKRCGGVRCAPIQKLRDTRAVAIQPTRQVSFARSRKSRGYGSFRKSWWQMGVGDETRTSISIASSKFSRSAVRSRIFNSPRSPRCFVPNYRVDTTCKDRSLVTASPGS